MHDTTIILIAYHFPPENTIGAWRPYRFFKYLKRFGYNCHVITASPQTGHEEDVTYLADPTRDFLESGRRNGPLPFSINVEKAIRRFVFPGHLGSTWSRIASAACTRIIRERSTTRMVLFSSYPSIGAHLAALQTVRKTNVPWIADFRDPMGLDPMLHQMPPFARQALRWTDGAVVRNAKLVLFTVESAGEAYAQNYPEAKDKVRVIWNGFDPENEPNARPIAERSQKILIHTGSLYHGRNANLVVESIIRLRARRSPCVGNLLLRLIGDVTPQAGLNEALYQRGIQEGWLEMPNQWVAQATAMEMTQDADALLLLQPQSKIQVPGKLFEYICIGRPILAVVPRDSAVEWVLARSGVPFSCLYPDDQADEIDRRLECFLNLQNTPVPASDWFRQNFDAEQQTRQLAHMVEELGR